MGELFMGELPVGDRPLIGIYEGRRRLPENIAIS